MGLIINVGYAQGSVVTRRPTVHTPVHRSQVSQTIAYGGDHSNVPVIGTGSTLTGKLKLASDEMDTGVLRAPGDRGTLSPTCRASAATAAAAAAAVVPPPPIGSKHNPVKKCSPSSMVIADVASKRRLPGQSITVASSDQLACVAAATMGK